MFESKGIVSKVGNKLEYVSPITGEVIKEFRKGWTGEKLQAIIDEWGQLPEVDNVDPDVGDIDPAELDIPSEDMMDES
jgi:hypothetical protein